MYFPNQRQITCYRENVEKDNIRLNNVFLCVYQENICEAMKNLTHTAFKVYVCLITNRSGYTIEFSPAHISQLSGLHPDTIRKAFKELQEKGYIECANEEKNLYMFYENERVKNRQKEKERRYNYYTGY